MKDARAMLVLSLTTPKCFHRHVKTMGWGSGILYVRSMFFGLCLAMLGALAIHDGAWAKAFSELDEVDAESDTATTPQKESIYDPLEFINRRIFWVNDKIDKIALKPVAKLYRRTIPAWGRQRIRSVLNNLNTPVYFVNSLAQGDTDQAFTSFWRFYMNTTFGIGGLYDIASLTGLEEREEDFGQTLGHYGIGPGPYLVLPLFGPSSLRNVTGRLVDSTVDPFNYTEEEFILARQGVDAVDSREDVLELLDRIEEGSIDPYAAIRSIYLQNQDDKIRNGAAFPTGILK